MRKQEREGRKEMIVFLSPSLQKKKKRNTIKIYPH